MPISSEMVASLQPGRERNRISLGKKLLVAWGGGLLWEVGLIITVAVLLSWLLSGVAFFSNPSDITGMQLLLIGMGLLTMVASTSLTGFFLSGGWRGMIGGLLAGVVGVVGFPAIYWSLGKLSVLLDRIGLLREVITSQPPEFGFSILVALSAAVVIVTVVMSVEALSCRLLGLGVGVVVGLGLSLISSLILGNRVGSNDLSSFIPIPPLVWVSAVYFPALFAGQGGWRGFLIWVLHVLVAFGLMFVVIPVTVSLFG